MTLSDVEIRAEIEAGWLKIDPFPQDRIVGSSIDLLLYNRLQILPESLAGITVDPAEVEINEFLETNSRQHDLDQVPLELEPGTFVIARTKEYISLPNHLAARVEGKSTLGRLGLGVHVTAPTIQAGYEGRLTLEMYNSGPFNLKLKPNMKICQLIVERLSIPAKRPYRGRFQGVTYEN